MLALRRYSRRRHFSFLNVFPVPLHLNPLDLSLQAVERLAGRERAICTAHQMDFDGAGGTLEPVGSARWRSPENPSCSSCALRPLQECLY